MEGVFVGTHEELKQLFLDHPRRNCGRVGEEGFKAKWGDQIVVKFDKKNLRSNMNIYGDVDLDASIERARTDVLDKAKTHLQENLDWLEKQV